MEGAVLVRVLVSDTGCPERAEVARTSGAAELDDGALALALDGVYVPRAREGVVLPGETTFRVSFQLND
jgi:TonB family protein